MDPIDAKSRALTALEPLELRLLPPEGLRFDEPVPVAWLRRALGETTDTGQPIEILGPGHLALEVTPLGEVSERPPVRIHGKVEGRVRTACVRCLEDVDLDVGDDVETTLFPNLEAAATPAGKDGKKKGRPASPKGTKDQRLEDWTDAEMPELEALDDGGYVGETIDLPGVLFEAVALSMDLNPSCADEAGCDRRTQALLEEANRPAREAEGEIDPRWAKLADLMTDESKDS